MFATTSTEKSKAIPLEKFAISTGSFLINFTSHAIKLRQHSIERDVDLHVVISLRVTQQMLVLRSSAWKCSMAVSDNDNTVLILFSRQQHSSQFNRAIDICSQARVQTFSSVEAEVVARWNLKQMSTDTQRVTLKSPKMSNDDDKQSNYRLMNALCRAKAIFADFSSFANSLSQYN